VVRECSSWAEKVLVEVSADMEQLMDEAERSVALQAR
jgi:hypothetical protein